MTSASLIIYLGVVMNSQRYKQAKYLIQLDSALDNHWKQVFESCELKSQDYNTQIISEYIDQPALHSLLRRIRDSGAGIVFIEQLDTRIPKKGDHK